MTDDRSNKHPDEETVAKWVGELSDAQPRGEFGDSLRSSFVSGEIDAASSAADATPRAPLPRTKPSWLRWLAPAVATAAVALFLLIGVDRGTDLQIADVTGTGFATIDGQAVDLSDRAAMTLAVKAGVEIELPAGATLDVAVNGTALYEVTGGSRMTLPDAPGRWFERAVTCSLFVGEVRIKTGTQFAGSELRVFTPEGMVVVTGTLLSVQCDDGGTCVCVLEGIARVGLDEEDLESVEPGFRKIMLRDGTKEIIPVKPMHRDGVLEFDDRAGHHLE